LIIGRASGDEELGGIRAVKHYLQRTAVHGSPTMFSSVTGEYVRGVRVRESSEHPFRRLFEALQVGDSLLKHWRTVTEADIVAFGGPSGRLLLHALRRHRRQSQTRASLIGRARR
jgi:oxepin-CoA hydrolase/3-oxo-5,6-dehydrosuberyl-CoA semialdehyde dehydrogenase